MDRWCSSHGMGSLEPPSESPEPDGPTGRTQPTYINLGEVRAHLLPSKAGRPRTPGSPSATPQPLPPPLPKKTLTRTQSLPNRGAPSPSAGRGGQTRRPLVGSLSVDESQAEAGPTCAPARLALELDAELGLRLHDLHSPEALHAALAARQLEGLRAIHARLRARFLGGRPGPCLPGHGFRLLDSAPCVESGDAFYYRVVRVDEEAWHILAAKVPKSGSEVPDPWGLELQASLPPHFNLQGLCGPLPEGALPAEPWRGPAALATEVPERTVAQWLAEAGAVRAQRPAEFAWAAALLLLGRARRCPPEQTPIALRILSMRAAGTLALGRPLVLRRVSDPSVNNAPSAGAGLPCGQQVAPQPQGLDHWGMGQPEV
ncbi:uncharacterized protein PEAK3 [Tupaia chinensis]|uniref:uncharacterized protein PEAK3 n=1 Tax=Tupaia chinensis TaxID=246437 RepID=UPI000FFB9F5F|nr:uncharacterized protein PEAK3 [Tupaia chinensis]